MFSLNHFLWLMLILFGIGLVADLFVVSGVAMGRWIDRFPAKAVNPKAVLLLVWRVVVVIWLLHLLAII